MGKLLNAMAKKTKFSTNEHDRTMHCKLQSSSKVYYMEYFGPLMDGICSGIGFEKSDEIALRIDLSHYSVKWGFLIALGWGGAAAAAVRAEPSALLQPATLHLLCYRSQHVRIQPVIPSQIYNVLRFPVASGEICFHKLETEEYI
uniref:Uncharacterized protein n=1 Tax=Oryza brachyantha TaxID=4533 RepID=J3LB38_ORYBR